MSDPFSRTAPLRRAKSVKARRQKARRRRAGGRARTSTSNSARLGGRHSPMAPAPPHRPRLAFAASRGGSLSLPVGPGHAAARGVSPSPGGSDGFGGFGGSSSAAFDGATASLASQGQVRGPPPAPSGGRWAERVAPPPSPLLSGSKLQPLDHAPAASRKLPSFLRNLLKDDLGRLRLDVNLEVHAESSGIPVTNATVQEVCELNPQMTSLCVRNCFDVSDAGLWAVARACTSLTTLNLSGLPEVSHVGIRAVTLRCRELATLDLSHCAGVHDLAMRVLAAGCWALTDLNLHGTKAITDAGICELTQCCKRLRRLNLSQIPGVADTCLLEMGRHCTDLRSLDLGHCTFIKDAGIAYVAHGCPFLASLRVSHCPDITGKGLLSLARHSKHLETLHLASCNRVKGNDVGVVLKGCRQLTELNIRECSGIREAAFRALGKYGDVLKVLNVSGMDHVVGNKAVSRIGDGCVALRNLDITGCPKVGNKGLRNLVIGCSRLTTLRLDEGRRCTPPFVQAIAEELPFVELAEGWYGLQALEDADERIALTELRRRQVAAATAMQRMWRGQSARQRVAALRLRAAQEHAAPHCQKVVRGWMGRQKAKRWRLALTMEESALTIQCAWRGYRGRCKMKRRRRLYLIRQNQNLAATMIQALWRGYCGRLRFERVRMDHFRRLQEASAEKSKRDRAARVIQGNYRIHLARVFMTRLRAQLKEAARVLALEHKMAARLQRVFRGHSDRQKVQRLRRYLAHKAMMEKAALRIQCQARAYFARRVADKLRAKRQAKREYDAIRLLQRVWRGSRGRHVMAVMRSLEQLRLLERAAVVKIQGAWRVFKARRFLASLKATAEAVQRRLDAAVTIQRMWRGAAARTDAEVRRALSKVEGVAAPLRKQIAELEEQRRKIEHRFLQCRNRVKEGNQLLKDWGAELEEVKTIKAKFYDSAKISGVPQRYKTSFLRQALETHIADMTKRLVVLNKKLTESAVDLRDCDRLLRAKRRELKPLEEDVEARARMSRDKRLKDRVLLERWAAAKLQALYRGWRVREAMAAGQNFWVELWDEASGYYYYYNTNTQRNTWQKPIDFDIYGDAEAQPTHSGWTRYFDKELQREYYYNVHSGEYRWEQPEDFFAEPTLRDPNRVALLEDEEDGGTGTGTGTVPSYEWLQQQDTAALTHRSQRGDTLGEWTELFDEATGAKYYVHNVTGEARWSLTPQSARGEDNPPDPSGEPVPPVAPSTQPPEYASREATVSEHPAFYGEEWWQHQNMEALSARSQRTGWFGDWNEYYDEASHATYYFNPSTGQSSWEVPEAIADMVARREEIEAERERARQAKIYNEEWFDAADKAELTARSDRQRAVNDWVEYHDPESGQTYYYNEATGESRWNAPDEVQAYDAVVAEYEAKDDMEFDADATERLQDMGVIKKERIQAGVLGWVPPAPIPEEDSSDDDDMVAIVRSARLGTGAGGGSGSGSRSAGAPTPSSARSDSGKTVWEGVNDLPRALRAKIKRIEREFAEYPDRDVHVTFLKKQLRGSEWLMASGIADQILTLQRRSAETAARIKARADIKQERMVALAERKAAETKARLEAEEAARLAAEEARRKQEQEEAEARELAAKREAKLKAKAEREAKERAEAEARAKAEAEAKALEDARLAREWAGMQRADKEGRQVRAFLERKRAERLKAIAEAEAEAARQEASKAAEAAASAETEKEILETQLDALRKKLRDTEKAKAQAEAEKQDALDTVRAVTEGVDAAETAAAAPAAAEVDPWLEVDDGQGNKYFYNQQTGESAWEKPVKKLQALVHTGMWHGLAGEDSGTESGAGAGEDDPYTAEQGAHAQAAPNKSPWHAVDDGEGNTYYFNEETHESRWDPPPDFADGAVTAVGAAAATVRYSSTGVPLGEEWHLVHDDDGNVYYFNEETGETQWDTPRPPDGPPPDRSGQSSDAAGDAAYSDAAAPVVDSAEPDA